MRYLFEEYVFDTDRRELHRGADVVSIAPQVFDLLDYLIRNRERVVSKDDLIKAVWNGRSVSDAALTTRLNVARIAIGDSGEEQRLIKTLPRKGFRFVGAVHERNRPSGVAAASEGHVESQKPALALPDKPSIAVLPFENMSGEPEQEYFTDGMVEDIITALSRFKELFVIARNSTFTYKGKPVDIKQLGHDLGVRYVLEGSVRKAANRLRIAGQLIDAVTGGHLWADHFDGGIEDVFELQDRVTSNVVCAIAPKLEQAEIERATRKPTESLDAYDYFLRGMAGFHAYTPHSFLEARSLFRRATELDPTYASPYGMAAFCINIGRSNGWLVDLERETREGIQLARRAAAIGKDDPTALWSSGSALGYLAGEIETGIALADHAAVLNPNLAWAWNIGGWLRVYLGEHEEAIERFERAIRLSPLDFTIHAYNGIGWAHLFAGRYEQAASWARKALRNRPHLATGAREAAVAYALSGNIAGAKEAMAQLLALDPGLRLSTIGRVAAPWRRAEDRALYLEGLRKAGLPE